MKIIRDKPKHHYKLLSVVKNKILDKYISITALVNWKRRKTSYFLEATLDFQDGRHSIIILINTVILLIFKNIGLDTKFMIVCNLEGSLCGIFNLEAAILKMVS